jgi:uncharacterized Fe-S cluster-containing radical SAM superfamily protein
METAHRNLCIRRLDSGGLITTYRCTSRCRHCLYGCSPEWPRHYIDDDTARASLETIRRLGCRAIHVGGGEPFLDPEALGRVLELAGEAGVHVEYVETNSSWYRDQQSACSLLRDLKSRGLTTLLISMSPFHNEFIPFSKVKGASQACLRSGIAAFPWIKAFYREIDAFDDRVPHGLSEYEEKYGGDYLRRIPSRYWIHFGGRALATFRAVLETQEAHAILGKHTRGCDELHDVSHFHLDLYGNTIPGLCSGLAVRHEDLGKPLDPARYPILTTLYSRGVGGLFRMASETTGYGPEGRYLSKCDLCFDIRRYLLLQAGDGMWPELQPRWIYEQA